MVRMHPGPAEVDHFDFATHLLISCFGEDPFIEDNLAVPQGLDEQGVGDVDGSLDEDEGCICVGKGRRLAPFRLLGPQ